MGPSGSGKTTLLNLIGLINEPSQGYITLKGQRSSHITYQEAATLRRQFLGFIFQSFNLFPVLNTFENVEYPLPHRRSRGDCQDPRSFGLAHQSPTPCAGKGPPSLSDRLSPPETQFNPLPSRSISEPTLPSCPSHTSNLPRCRNSWQYLVHKGCTRVEKGLLAACPPHLQTADWRD